MLVALKVYKKITAVLKKTILVISFFKKTIILIGEVDAYVLIDYKLISPFAESLLRKLMLSNEKAMICITGCKSSKSIIEYPLFDFTRLSKILLKYFQPKAFILIDYNSHINVLLNNLKIPCYYIQHGVICEDHLIFGRNVLKSRPKEELFDGFLAWDEYSASNFEGITKKFTIGNLWVKRFLEKETDELITKLRNTKSVISKEQKNQKNNKVILLTLTWGNPDYRFIPSNVIRAINKSPNYYVWVIKLHPVVLKNKEYYIEFVEFLKNNSLEKIFLINDIQLFAFTPLPILLEIADLHITIESSCVIEAAQFGIKSLILNEKVFKLSPEGLSEPPYGGPSYFKYELDMGYAECVKPDIDILRWIESNIDSNLPPLLNDDLNKQEWSIFLNELNQRIKTNNLN